MISHYINKELCCGCSACSLVCPKHCIEMTEDHEGFLYPLIDKGLCVDCGLCEKVCPFINPYGTTSPEYIYGAYNKEDSIRKNSSSGGIFYLIAKKVIENGGVVFGACYDENWEVVIDYVDNVSEICKLQGSKYVQAKIGTSYIICKKHLDEGKIVLFSGTPCQVSGLRHFLRKDYANLFLLDFVCHGVPSPKVWRLYVKELLSCVNVKTHFEKKSLLKRQRTCDLKRFHFSTTASIDGGLVKLSMPYSDNEYMRLFLNNTILRPSCYSCKVKGCSSKSDITIGDFWGINTINSNFDDDRGLSVVMFHSKKGFDIFDFDQVNYIQVSFEDACHRNSSLLESSIPNIKRSSFFEKVEYGNILNCMREFSISTKKEKVKQLIKQLLRCLRDDNQKSLKYDNYQIKDICFRNKDTGWRSYSFTILLQNKKLYQ